MNMGEDFKPFPPPSRAFLKALSLEIVALVGFFDYRTGFELDFFAFYLIPVTLAVWFIGRNFGAFISALCTVVSSGGDILAGAHYASPLVPVWNAAIALVFYLVVVWILSKLRTLQNELEERVRQRTAALHNEMQERTRLEQEILRVSEREQRRIGHDLHDSLAQHWAAAAMAVQVLGEKLAGKSLPETADAKEIVKIIGEGIRMTRSLAHGISLAEMESDGLLVALGELAANTSNLFKVRCVFETDGAPQIQDPTTATHLYRIAQEAIHNAIRHGKPKQIVVNLSRYKERVGLTIEDDGAGLPEDWQKSHGLGTRIMAHRAALIGGVFSIEPSPTGGTFVKCSLPAENKNAP